jgi:hypothetical protein
VDEAKRGVPAHVTVLVPFVPPESTAVMDSAERAIVGGMPIRAQAHEIWLMVGDGRWTLRARFALGG